MSAKAKAKVRELLKKVQKLKTEYDKVKDNPTKAVIKQCEIFRTFQLIDAIKSSCQDTGTPRKMLEEEVSKMKTKCAAERKDFDQMIIPALNAESGPQKEIGTEKGIHQVLDLPSEILSKLFVKLFNSIPPAYDDMDMITQKSAVDELEKWGPISCLFESICPGLKEKKMEEFKDVLSLIKDNSFRKPIVEKFAESLLENIDGSYVPLCFKDVLTALDEANCRSIIPIPTEVNFLFQHKDDITPPLIKELRRTGALFWSCRIIIDRYKNFISDFDCSKMISKMLSFMPSLRHLEIVLSAKKFSQIEDFTISVLPNLPELKSLYICSNVGTASRCVISQKLISKFKSRLRRLRVYPFSKICPRVADQAKQLEILEIVEEASLDAGNFGNLLKSFAGSPLVQVCVKVNKSKEIKPETLSALLESLSMFGSTLSELQLKINFPLQPSQMFKNPLWITKYSFPVVKKLLLQNFTLDIPMLVQFPLLEHLTFTVTPSASPILSYFLKLENIYTYPVWKLFPFLHTIDVKQYCYDEGKSEQNKCLKTPIIQLKASRKDSIAFQRGDLSVSL